jgi:hypothetical protein
MKNSKFIMTLKKYKFLNKDEQNSFRTAVIKSVDYYLSNGWSIAMAISKSSDDSKLSQDLIRHIYGRVDREKYPKRNGSIATYKRLAFK